MVKVEDAKMGKTIKGASMKEGSQHLGLNTLDLSYPLISQWKRHGGNMTSGLKILIGESSGYGLSFSHVNKELSDPLQGRRDQNGKPKSSRAQMLIMFLLQALLQATWQIVKILASLVLSFPDFALVWACLPLCTL